MSDEQLKCNICGVSVNASEAMQHAASSSHESRQAELKQELAALINESYNNDSSVVVRWETSTSQ